MRFYHYAQFGGHFKISNDDLAKLRTIDSGKSTVSKENYKKQVQLQEQKAAVADKTLSLEIEDTLTTSNGTIKVETELNAVLRPFECLHTPNGKQLSLFLTKEGAFFHLLQLEDAGVDLSCIRRRFELENYEGEFAHYLSLSDAFSKSDISNLYDWWRNAGFPYVDKTSKEFSEAREFVLKHFGIDFPDELESLEQQYDEIIQALRDKPMWLIFKTRSAFLRLNDKWKTKLFVARLCEECHKIWEERSKTLTKTPKVTVLDKVAKKLANFKRLTGRPSNCLRLKAMTKFLLTAHSWQLPLVVQINLVRPLTVPVSAKPSMPLLNFTLFVGTTAANRDVALT